MQKTELTLRSAHTGLNTFSFSSVTLRLSRTSVAGRLAAFYSDVLDKRVTPVQAVCYVYAVVTGVAALAPFALDLGWRAFAFTLFCLAVKKAAGRG